MAPQGVPARAGDAGVGGVGIGEGEEVAGLDDLLAGDEDAHGGVAVDEGLATGAAGGDDEAVDKRDEERNLSVGGLGQGEELGAEGRDFGGGDDVAGGGEEAGGGASTPAEAAGGAQEFVLLLRIHYFRIHNSHFLSGLEGGNERSYHIRRPR